jgi:hypothetical protein
MQLMPEENDDTCMSNASPAPADRPIYYSFSLGKTMLVAEDSEVVEGEELSVAEESLPGDNGFFGVDMAVSLTVAT